MRVTVTGGAGFIGSSVVEQLLEDGCDVAVLDNFSSGSAQNLTEVADRIRIIHGSITDPAAVREALQGSEAVVHLGAMVSVPLSFEDPVRCAEENVGGTVQVLSECSAQGVKRFVQASTSAVYGALPGFPKREDSPLSPVSPYGASKLAAEHFAGAFSAKGELAASSLRIFNAYGPRQDPTSPYSGVISLFMNRIAQGLPVRIYGDGLNTRDFIYVRDVAKVISACLNSEDPGHRIFNVATGRSVTLLDLLRILETLVQNKVSKIFESPREGDIPHSSADVSLLERELGFTPAHTLEKGLETTFQALYP